MSWRLQAAGAAAEPRPGLLQLIAGCCSVARSGGRAPSAGHRPPARQLKLFSRYLRSQAAACILGWQASAAAEPNGTLLIVSSQAQQAGRCGGEPPDPPAAPAGWRCCLLRCLRALARPESSWQCATSKSKYHRPEKCDWLRITPAGVSRPSSSSASSGLLLDGSSRPSFELLLFVMSALMLPAAFVDGLVL